MRLDNEWFARAATAAGDAALALLQGYPYTCFAKVSPEGILELPPPFRQSPPNWDLFQDVRVFSPKVEWHAWRVAPGDWRDRPYVASEHNPNEIPRSFALWGSRVKHEREDGWTCCDESRGAEVWVPFAVDPNCVELLLDMKMLVDYSDAGVAGITDAVITRLRGGRP